MLFVLSVLDLLGPNYFSGGTFIGTVLEALVAILSGSLAGGTFLWRYYRRHSEEYTIELRARIQQQELERATAEREEVEQLVQTLDLGFARVDSPEGTKAISALRYQYQQLQPVLARKEDTDSISMTQIPSLAYETYRQGLDVLTDVLRLTQAMKASDVNRLTSEIEDMEKEMESLSGDSTQVARAQIKEATINSNRELLDLLGQQQLRIDELLFQSNRCQASLARTRLEAASLQSGGTETSVNSVTESLQRTINQAKEVQEELKRLGL